MDPNTVLQELRKAFAEMPNCYDNSDWADWLIEVRSNFNALDDWLTNGGFPPAPWNNRRNTITGDAQGKIIQCGNIVGDLDMSG